MNATLRHALPWLLVAALGLSLKLVYDGRRRAEGREAVLVQQRDSVERELRRVSIRRADTVYQRDTVPLWRTLRKTDTLIRTLLRSDTVTLTKRESVLVFVADSLVRQCTAAIRSCEARVAARDSLLSVLTVDRDYWRRKSSPSLLTQLSTASKWLAVGFVIGVTR